MTEGHNEPCYYCQLPCNNLIGNPSMWPIPLSHSDDPGKVKWHHTGCVSLRLHKLEILERAIAEIKHAEEQYDKHTMAYIKAITGQTNGPRNTDTGN